MNIISVDLPWNPNNKGRRVLAVADLDKNISILTAKDDTQMLDSIKENTEKESLVLLDIPIDGCKNLGNGHFRPVDRALARRGISILPTSKAKDRGKRLEGLIQNNSRGRRITVQEIYPYAIYKFLAYLKDRRLLQRLNLDKFDILLDEGFLTFLPPKYKREKKKDERLKDMEYLYSLLTDTDIGLNFQPPLRHPDTSRSLGQLGDEYDACLGAMAGLHFASNSSYACIAGDSNSGNILLLADQWLAEHLGKEVQIYTPVKRSSRYGIGS